MVCSSLFPLLLLLVLLATGTIASQATSENLRRAQEAEAREEGRRWYTNWLNAWQPKQPIYRFPSEGIIGGTDATSGTYPWFVSLESSGSFFCGGTLISANRVLTAAHCLVSQSGSVTAPTQVRIGNVGTTDGETRGVSCVSIHPSYTLDTLGLFYDVAVIKLSTDSSVTSFVSLNSNTGYPSSSGQTLTAIGFGRTVSGGSTSSTLKVASESFVTETDCQSTWVCASSTYHVCAGAGTNVGVCQGDSGGPLLDSSNVQVGITSFGDANCGTPADVFTNVAQYYSWIQGELTSSTCSSSHTFPASPCDASLCCCARAVRNFLAGTAGSIKRYFEF